MSFLLRGSEIAGFDVSGHTGLASAGQDILCAAISSAVYLTSNTITDVIGVQANISVADGRFSLLVPPGEEEKCRVVLEGLMIHLKQLREQYPKGLRIININTREGA